VTALVTCSPIAVVFAFSLLMLFIVVDGIHQNLTNPAQRHPISKGVQRRRAVGK
tara:strand:- start:140 stop:301 length:162 start_codon:yes stop_codon:yes gene_type:complete